MTKARARERAKAKAALKGKKRNVNADRPEQSTGPAQFDARGKAIPSPRESVNLKSNSGAIRGSARSR